MSDLFSRTLRIVLLFPTLVFVSIGWRWSAFGLLSAILLLNTSITTRVKESDEFYPRAVIWSRVLHTGLLAGIIGVLLFQEIYRDGAEIPRLLLINWIMLLIQFIAYPLFSFSALRKNIPMEKPDFWSRASRVSITLATMLLILKIDHFQEILLGVSILLLGTSAVSFLYSFFRNPVHRKQLTIATQLTFSRIVLTPVFIIVFFYDGDLIYSNNNLIFKSLALLMVISFMLTDFLDGHLARKYNQVSTLGKFLDPFSDKISNMTIFICFLASGYANIWMVALIYFREASVETLRTLAASQGLTIAARQSGKWKTGIQMGGILAILVGALDPIQSLSWVADIWDYFPNTIMGIITAVTLLSGIDYFVANRSVLAHYL